MSLKKYKSQGKTVEVTVNSKEENSSNFCLDFVQEFGFGSVSRLIQVDENKWENSCRDTAYRDALLTICVYRRGEPGLAGVPRLMQPQATAQHCSRQLEQINNDLCHQTNTSAYLDHEKLNLPYISFPYFRETKY